MKLTERADAVRRDGLPPAAGVRTHAARVADDQRPSGEARIVDVPEGPVSALRHTAAFQPALPELSDRQPATPHAGQGAPPTQREQVHVPVTAPDPLAQMKARTTQELFERIGSRLNDASLSEEKLHAYALTELGAIVSEEQVPLSDAERDRFLAEISADVLGYGPLEVLLADDEVTEIMVNGPDQIFVERRGRLLREDARFTSEGQLRRVIERIVSKVGRRIDESSPLVDARLADGSRVNAIIPPLAVDGSSLTIRKFSREPFTADDLIRFGTLTPDMAEVLEACVKARLNIIVSGGTGTGKTTLLNVLSGFIPPAERIITIEDAVELQLQQEHVIRLESRPSNTEGRGEVSIRDLVRNSLRMRPDRIVIGECRSGETLDMLQAMNTGHEGSISTVHANSPRDAIARMETLVLMAGMELPLRAVREQIASAIDVIVQISRMKDGTRRVTHVTEVQGMEVDIVTLQDVFVFDRSAGVDRNGNLLGRATSSGVRPRFADRFPEVGIELPAHVFGSGILSRESQ